MLDVIEGLEAVHHLSLVARRRRLDTERPGHDVDILFLEQRLIPFDLRVAPRGAVAIEKAPDHQVGLARAAMPGAEVQAFEAGFAVHRIVRSMTSCPAAAGD